MSMLMGMKARYFFIEEYKIVVNHFIKYLSIINVWIIDGLDSAFFIFLFQPNICNI